MRGRMTERPLLLIDILRHGARIHRDAEVISSSREGAIGKTSYEGILQRAAQLANALTQHGLAVNSMIGTLAWNNFAHLEIYFATAGLGAICHTINPRLSSDQILELIRHAGDDLLFVESDLVQNISQHIGTDGFPKMVVLCPSDEPPPQNTVSYEEFIRGQPDAFEWPTLDERTASSLCYTSGTTGKPKGILYSHRSSVLHAMSICRTDTWAISGDDIICPFAPMFHVNGWGIPHAAPLCGADLILPGPHLRAQDIYRIIETHQVTLSLAVPTIWHELLNYMAETAQRFTSLRRVIVSGSPLPPDMLARFEDDHNVDVLQAWGMTESSPMGMVSRLSRRMRTRSKEKQIELRLQQGRPVFGIEAKLLDVDTGLDAAGDSTGECAIRGLWVASSYFRGEAGASDAFLEDGWFKTGDVAAINQDGFFRIVDRRKDAIKSGGEWISSIELENAALHDSQVLDAAAVAVPHEKWGERPALVVSIRQGDALDREQLMEHLRQRLQKWALPDRILVFSELPRSTAGKLLKNEIRAQVLAIIEDLDEVSETEESSAKF